MSEDEFLATWMEGLRLMAQHYANADADDAADIADRLADLTIKIYNMSNKDPHNPEPIIEHVKYALSLCRQLEDKLNSILSREEAIMLAREYEEFRKMLTQNAGNKLAILFDFSGSGEQGDNE